MEKVYLTNEVIQAECRRIAKQIIKSDDPIKIYGIPRGGIPVAYMVFAELQRIGKMSIVVEKPEDATCFVDDIIDSGATKKRFSNKPFYAIIENDNKKVGTWYTFPWEQGLERDTSALDVPLRLIQYIGEDPTRDGLKDTPKRFIKAWDFLCSGYNVNESNCLGTVFNNEEHYDEMIVLRDIEFYSTCEHHLLPFFGKCHIAYIPTDKVVGISKLARLVECFSRRLQIQERLTQQIANAIENTLHPLGVAVVIEAQHFCMMSRGIQKQNAAMITSSLKGVLKEREGNSRLEFLLLKK